MHTFTVRTENRPAHPDRRAQSNKKERAFAHTTIDEFLASLDDQASDCIGEITLTIVHQNTHLGIIYALEYEFTFEMEGAKHPVHVAGRHELRQIGNTGSVIDAMRYDLVTALEQAEEASLREHEVIKRWTEHWREQQVAYRNRTSK